jgi:hypothetical protein
MFYFIRYLSQVHKRTEDVSVMCALRLSLCSKSGHCKPHLTWFSVWIRMHMYNVSQIGSSLETGKRSEI